MRLTFELGQQQEARTTGKLTKAEYLEQTFQEEPQNLVFCGMTRPEAVIFLEVISRVKMAQVSLLGGEASFHCVSLLCLPAAACFPLLQDSGVSLGRNWLPEFQASNVPPSVSSAPPLETDVGLNTN